MAGTDIKKYYIILAVIIAVFLIIAVLLYFLLRKTDKDAWNHIYKNFIIKNSDLYKKFPSSQKKVKEDPEYFSGINFGGWLVMEAFIFPNIPLINNVYDFKNNSEWGYIHRLVQLFGPEKALLTMHNHWANFITDKDLQRLVDLNVTRVRIPVGWWIMDAPLPGYILGKGGVTCPSLDDIKNNKLTNRDIGFQAEGFVTGGITYLELMIKKLKRLGITAVIDVHSLPGGAQVGQTYSGDWFDKQNFWCGVDPCTNETYISKGSKSILKICDWIKSLENNDSTSNVVFGLTPVNEPYTGEDPSKAVCSPGGPTILDASKKDFWGTLMRKVRDRLGTKYTLVYNFLAMPTSSTDRYDILTMNGDKNIWVDLHYYTAWNQCNWAPNVHCYKDKQCDELTQCVKCCSRTAEIDLGNGKKKKTFNTFFSMYPQLDFPCVVGEWSISICDNNIDLKSQLIDKSSNYYIQRRNYINTKTAFMKNVVPNDPSYANAGTHIKGDFYWTLKIAKQYDPTMYPRGWLNKGKKPNWWNLPFGGVDQLRPLNDFPEEYLLVWDYFSMADKHIVVNMDDVKVTSTCNWSIDTLNVKQSNTSTCPPVSDKNPCPWDKWKDSKGAPCGCGCEKDEQCPNGFKCNTQHYGYGGQCVPNKS